MCLGPCTELAAQGLAWSQSTAGQADGQMDSQTGYCISVDHLSRAKAWPPSPGVLASTPSLYSGGEVFPVYNPEALPSHTGHSQPQAIRMSQPEGPSFEAQRR